MKTLIREEDMPGSVIGKDEMLDAFATGKAILDMSGIDTGFIKKWAVALRSGDYCQGKGYLRMPEAFANNPDMTRYNGEFDPDEDISHCYCCIGVACLVQGIDPVDQNGKTSADEPEWNDENPGFTWGDWRLSLLANLNDGNNYGRKPLTFEQIADIIDPSMEPETDPGFVYGSQVWAETQGDDRGESSDF